MSKKTSTAIFIIVIVLIIASIAYYFYKQNQVTPFQYVQNKGAKPTTTPNSGDRYDFGDYGFYSNNRVVQFSTKKLGTYTNKVITWDDGSQTLLINIF